MLSGEPKVYVGSSMISILCMAEFLLAHLTPELSHPLRSVAADACQRCAGKKPTPRRGFGLNELSGRTALYANDFRRLRVHKHKAPAKQSFLAELIEDVVTARSDENLVSGESTLVVVFDCLPVRFGDFEQNHGGNTMVVLNQYISILHVHWIHIGMRMEDPSQRFLCVHRGRGVIQIRRQNGNCSIREYCKVTRPAGVVPDSFDDHVQRLHYVGLPVWHWREPLRRPLRRPLLLEQSEHGRPPLCVAQRPSAPKPGHRTHAATGLPSRSIRKSRRNHGDERVPLFGWPCAFAGMHGMDTPICVVAAINPRYPKPARFERFPYPQNSTRVVARSSRPLVRRRFLFDVRRDAGDHGEVAAPRALRCPMRLPAPCRLFRPDVAGSFRQGRPRAPSAMHRCISVRAYPAAAA